MDSHEVLLIIAKIGVFTWLASRSGKYFLYLLFVPDRTISLLKYISEVGETAFNKVNLKERVWGVWIFFLYTLCKVWKEKQISIPSSKRPHLFYTDYHSLSNPKPLQLRKSGSIKQENNVKSNGSQVLSIVSSRLWKLWDVVLALLKTVLQWQQSW